MLWAFSLGYFKSRSLCNTVFQLPVALDLPSHIFLVYSATLFNFDLIIKRYVYKLKLQKLKTLSHVSTYIALHQDTFLCYSVAGKC
jgi:hypothetical protein